MQADIASILESSENLKEDLLALGDEIWQSIDHSDDEALEEGVRVKKEFNEAVYQFTESIGRVSNIVDGHTPQTADPAPETTILEDEARVIAELDRHEPYTLNGSFAYKRPVGFKLGEYAASDLRTWRRLYEHTCQHLAERFPERFANLPDTDEFITNRGNLYFSRDPNDLRTSSVPLNGIFAEVHFSATDIAKRIAELMNYFEIPLNVYCVYLREDRNA